MQLLFRLLIFLNQPYKFWATNSPILRSIFDCIYCFWYNAPTLLQTESAPEDGRICRPKHVGLN